MKQDSMLYEQAADLVMRYSNTHAVPFVTAKEEVVSLLNDFQEKFAPQVLKSLPDDALLRHIFLTVNGTEDSLCYHLEFTPKLKRAFGSIAGGSSFEFGLFQRQEDGKWVTGTSQAPQVLSEAEALQLGKTIRDNLVKACERIQARPLDSVEAYEKLDDDLHTLLGELAAHAWVQKYFHLIFPEQFVGWYATDQLKHILFGLGIKPSEKYYGMNGQLALIKKKTGYLSPHFEDLCSAMFGKIRHFYRLSSSDESAQYAERWREKGIIAIGWKKTGDLLNYIRNGVLDKNKVAEALAKQYYPGDKKTASRKAEEIKSFYETSSSSVVTVMDGCQLIAFVDGLSPYFYDENAPMAHQKSGVWHSAFAESDSLPEDEGALAACYEIQKPENLLFLYKKYYWSQEPETPPLAEDECLPVKFHTGYRSSFERNRILFGAPGTGKSFTLNHEKDLLLKDGGEFERVTFHPDYSYANFVGTYKPVPCKDSDGKDTITYSYVPGPFMRIYVKALRNSRTDFPKPFLLVIEEINRANVAAVFGDVFQLLDRGDDEVSEYPIQASEDIKKYLSGELGGSPDDYSEIRIPDNMFLWATMNSADQGVFPMDTAFKRRWDFTYLGIDDSEAGIAGKKVILGQGKNRRIVEWNKLRKAINNELLTYRVNEDKLMGPYFISKKNLPDDETIDPVVFTRIFKSKVIMYLFDDAAKQKRPTLFSGCTEKARNQYSKICKEFDTKGVFIFCEAISDQFIDTVPEDEEE